MSLRKYLMRQQKGKCHYCNRFMTIRPKGKYFATEDHIIPKSRGGGNSFGNLVGACFTCNNMRGDLPYQVFKTFIRLHGNDRSIGAVLKSLSSEDYEKHKSIYDEITASRINSHIRPALRPPVIAPETAPVTPIIETIPTCRRPFLHLTRCKIRSIIDGIPYHRKLIILSGEDKITIKESETCQTSTIPSQQFLTTSMLGSLPRQKRTAKALWT